MNCAMQTSTRTSHGFTPWPRSAGRLTATSLIPSRNPSSDRDIVWQVTEMKLYDVRVTVERIEGRSVCGLEVGDYFEVTESSRVRIPDGRHFCLDAPPVRAAAHPPRRCGTFPPRTGSSRTPLVACPDPDERVVMRIERIGERVLVTEELT